MCLRRTTNRKTTMDLSHMKTFFFLCLLLNAISCERFEPRCTKVDFAERLLKKTVRFKVEMRLIKNEYTQMINELLEERKNITNERKLMRETIENVIEQNLQKLNTLEGGVKDTGEKLVKDVNDATTAMEATQQQNEAKLMRLSADHDETIKNIKKTLSDTPDVFFVAKDLAYHSMSNNNATFVFTTVVENGSGGYNGDDGIFTVPVDGDYLFTTQLCSLPNQYVYFAFTIDGQRKKVTVFGMRGFTCNTATLIARVKAGSRVELENTSASRTYCDKENYVCYFSGYLLKRTLY